MPDDGVMCRPFDFRPRPRCGDEPDDDDMYDTVEYAVECENDDCDEGDDGELPGGGIDRDTRACLGDVICRVGGPSVAGEPTSLGGTMVPVAFNPLRLTLDSVRCGCDIR